MLQDEQGRLSESTRRTFANHILEHLESNVRHDGKKYPLRHVIQMQARQIVRYVRRECEAYMPFKASW